MEYKTPTQIKGRLKRIRNNYLKRERIFYEEAFKDWANGKFSLKPSSVKDLVDHDMYCDSEVEVLKAKLESWNNCMEFYGN